MNTYQVEKYEFSNSYTAIAVGIHFNNVDGAIYIREGSAGMLCTEYGCHRDWFLGDNGEYVAVIGDNMRETQLNDFDKKMLSDFGIVIYNPDMD